MKTLRTLSLVGVAAVLSLQAQTSPQAPTTFFSFNGGTQGAGPLVLLQGADGNFYGLNMIPITLIPTIFQITPAGVFTPIYQDLNGGNGPDSLVVGSDGNLYGITPQEGSCMSDPILGCGSVFKVTPQGAYTLLYAFNGTTDGDLPSSLVEGGDGNFYGVTSAGATSGGTVFRVTPSGSFGTVYTFSAVGTGSAAGGTGPFSLTVGPNRTLYGNTSWGGANSASKCPMTTVGNYPAGCGTIFKIGGGSVTTLYSFAGGDDGSLPFHSPGRG